jgi:lipoyl(octanoyl) transferase
MSDSPTIASFTIEDFGLADYESIWQRQLAYVDERAQNASPEHVLLGEHLPILTLGRSSKPEHYANATLPLLPVERGGNVTYHGPGQLVVYPIFHLSPEQRDLHRYLRDLESVIILTLADFGVEGHRAPGKTGIWLVDRVAPSKEPTLKIASIGVAVRRWVTYHGFALNVNPQMSHFQQINPCGFPSKCMTSLAMHLPQPPTMAAVKQSVLKHLRGMREQM